MSEVRSTLERIGERVVPPADAFETLARRRERHHRRRRVLAGVVALLVAACGTAGVWLAFRSPGIAPVAARPDSFHALYPAWTATDAAQVQQDLTAGVDPRLGDPTAVAERFAVDIMGWPPADLSTATEAFADSGVANVQVIECAPGAHCPARIPTVDLTLEQLVRRGPGGAWFVTSVSSPHGASPIQMRVQPGATLVSGQTITARVDVPDGTAVLAGYDYVSETYDEFPVHWVRVRGGTVTFQVATRNFAVARTQGSGSGSVGVEPLPGLLSRPINGFVVIAVHPGPISRDPFGGLAERLAGGQTSWMSHGNPAGSWFMALAAVPVRFVPAR